MKPLKQYERSWGAVVYRNTKKNPGSLEFLLVRQRNGGHWDHPKGHGEPGEQPPETARREIQEEGGVLVNLIDGFLEEAQWTLASGIQKLVGYFLAEATGKAPTGGPEDEILERNWFSLEQAREQLTYSNSKEILDAAVNYMNRPLSSQSR